MKKRLRMISGILMLTLIIASGVIQLTGEPENKTKAKEDNSNKKYNLKGKLDNKKALTITYERESNAIAKVPSMPRHAYISFYEKYNKKISQKSLKTEGVNIIKLKRTYTQSLMSPFENKPKGKPDLFNKQTIEIEIKDKKESINSRAIIPDEIKNNLDINENNFLLFLPENEVKEGDEWNVNPEIVSSVIRCISTRQRMRYHGALDIGLAQVFPIAKMQCKLSKVKKIKGKETAIIDMSGELTGDDQGLKQTIILTGTGYFVLKTEQFSEVKFEGKIIMEGDQLCTGNRMVLTTGEGNFKLTVKFKYPK